MSRRAVDSLFHALFALTDLRCMLRETAPSHAFGKEERERIEELLKVVEREMRIIREELMR